MSLENGRKTELFELLEALCEERLTEAQVSRLEELVLSSCEARRFYLEYIDLHGTLHWDAAAGNVAEYAGAAEPSNVTEPSVAEPSVAEPSVAEPSVAEPSVAEPSSVAEFPRIRAAEETSPEFSGIRLRSDRPAGDIDELTRANAPTVPRTRLRRTLLVALVSCVVLAVGLFLQRTFFVAPNAEVDPLIARGNPENRDPETEIDRSVAGEQHPERTSADPIRPRDGNPLEKQHPKISLNRPDLPKPEGAVPSPDPDAAGSEKQPGTVARRENDPLPPGDKVVPDAGSSSEVVVAFIDEQIRAGWDAAQVQPSPVADDAEWIRRVYLDIVGHIPPPQVVERFLNDRNPRKRPQLVDTLLDDPAYVRHWTTVWANLLIGRSMSRDVSRPALEKFLRESFARNRPWSEVVFDLVAAEGDYEENGAANFLLAHLNNEAVPATAITARLFLGTQVQCTQCHNHPFNDSTQDEFWELNCFFQQTEKQRLPRSDADRAGTQLVSVDVGGPIFYESRTGLMRAAYPKFAGTAVDPAPNVNRRRELARLMTEGEKPLVAAALVNRLWEHFLGAGFTRPVDDMGPHNPASHPELFDRLAREFVAAGYDVKQLVRWITNSQAYQLTSRFNDTNGIDEPSVGDPPLFSRVYVRPMTAEQLYDSLLVATRAHHAGAADWAAVAAKRQQWLQQFVLALETDENDEATTFDGTLPQALMMMNGELIAGAVQGARGTYLHEVLAENTNEAEKIRELSLAALSRYPTSREMAAFRKLLADQVAAKSHRGPNRQAALAEALQDVFWALLNSSEFILVH